MTLRQEPIIALRSECVDPRPTALAVNSSLYLGFVRAEPLGAETTDIFLISAVSAE
jgi:hypothetical protein